MVPSSPLELLIVGEIRAKGPVSFHRFMELCLYHPQLGYYERSAQRVGKGGDFFTSVSVGSAFGYLLATQVNHWAKGREEFHIIEAGAHDGTLCRDILGSLEEIYSAPRSRFHYLIVEPSDTRRGWQEEKLAPFAGRVRWVRDLCDIAEHSIDGVGISNELLDSMPVHRVGWSAEERDWFEWSVTQGATGFEWTRAPLNQSLRDSIIQLYFGGEKVPDSLGDLLPDGFTLDYSPGAERWWTSAARVLRDGRLVMFDYGMEVGELIRPERLNGTVRAYANHRVTDNILDHPGEQDLTAHVNLTQLIRAGEAAGLATETLTYQARFLSSVLAATDPSQLTPAIVRQIQTLIHPDHLGAAFRVLVQKTSQ